MAILKNLISAGILLSLFFANGYSQKKTARSIYPNRIVLGFGGNYGLYTTKWKITEKIPLSPDLLKPAVHVHELYDVVLFSEKRAAMKFGKKISLDIRGELGIKVYGETQQDYLSDSLPPTLSTKGSGYSGGIHFRIAYPTRMSHALIVVPFIGTGAEFFFLESTGRGIDSRYSEGDYENRSYKIGWTEYGVSNPLEAGFNLDLKLFSLIPEVRYYLLGYGDSSLQGTPKITFKNLNFWAVQLTIGFNQIRFQP